METFTSPKAAENWLKANAQGFCAVRCINPCLSPSQTIHVWEWNGFSLIRVRRIYQ